MDDLHRHLVKLQGRNELKPLQAQHSALAIRPVLLLAHNNFLHPYPDGSNSVHSLLNLSPLIRLI